MKRTKMIGLCAVAAFAFAALAGVSTASAAQFNVCAHVGKGGNYTEAACKTESLKKGKPAHKGAYEKKVGGECFAMKKGNYTESKCETESLKKGKPAHKGSYELADPSSTVTGGHAELVSAAGTIECSSSTGTQKITGAKSIVATTLFKGCETKGQKCTSFTGAKAEGEIETLTLDGALVEPHTGQASINITGADGHEAEFACVGVAYVRVSSGPLGGKITPVGSYVTSETTTFEEKVEQGLIAEFASSPTFEGAESLPSEQLGSVTASGTTDVEIAVA